MGGFFGTISKEKCVNDLFYGTDYNSHMGTKRGGLATYSKEDGFDQFPSREIRHSHSGKGREHAGDCG